MSTSLFTMQVIHHYEQEATVRDRPPTAPGAHFVDTEVIAKSPRGASQGLRVAPTLTRIGLLLIVAVSLAGCGWVSSIFGKDDKVDTTSISAFDVKVGQCFNPPGTVQAEIPNLDLIPCDQGHLMEAFLLSDYVDANGASDTYPGVNALKSFAQGRCAQAVMDYVGVSYQDSSLFTTFLFPSARSWESDKDRTVICFLTTTGETLTSSVAGSKK
ncbi:hypothetical protein EH165_07450 [Nakamurella antarctica]|uniref:Septum formation-related domain-containing protein n=1 Tax=Nakamurella antarctica TaxID=1902245 RepID=A0A3G8ZL09_9ACTN|nr:septum formation family protein [Nakamurella antarctica]AZI57999.1 hypothetical protein EH165_07450 [Nakamurella antarctica]